MKRVTWYLPSGAGGMAAQHRVYHIKNTIGEWRDAYAPDAVFESSVYSENGLRYFTLNLPDEYATIFALTWDNTIPKTHYEYINDYIPQVHTK